MLYLILTLVAAWELSLCRYYQISQGKNIRFRFMWLLYLRNGNLCSNWAFVSLATSPLPSRLIYSFCSSAQTFAASFLQIPPRDGHPCYWLMLLTAKCIRVLHPIADTHAWHTTTKALPKAFGTRLLTKFWGPERNWTPRVIILIINYLKNCLLTLLNIC